MKFRRVREGSGADQTRFRRVPGQKAEEVQSQSRGSGADGWWGSRRFRGRWPKTFNIFQTVGDITWVYYFFLACLSFLHKVYFCSVWIALRMQALRERLNNRQDLGEAMADTVRLGEGPHWKQHLECVWTDPWKTWTMSLPIQILIVLEFSIQPQLSRSRTLLPFSGVTPEILMLISLTDVWGDTILRSSRSNRSQKRAVAAVDVETYMLETSIECATALSRGWPRGFPAAHPKGLCGRFVLGLGLLLPGKVAVGVGWGATRQSRDSIFFWFCRAVLRGLGSIHITMRLKPRKQRGLDPGLECFGDPFWFGDEMSYRPFASDLIGCGNLKCGEINYFQNLGFTGYHTPATRPLGIWWNLVTFWQRSLTTKGRERLSNLSSSWWVFCLLWVQKKNLGCRIWQG